MTPRSRHRFSLNRVGNPLCLLVRAKSRRRASNKSSPGRVDSASSSIRRIPTGNSSARSRSWALSNLNSKDKRFGGLSGLTIGADGKLYAISDQGYWLSARMVSESRRRADGSRRLANRSHARPRPKLPSPVPWRMPKRSARAQDGSFLVAFEGRHRIWRYDAPPRTFDIDAHTHRCSRSAIARARQRRDRRINHTARRPAVGAHRRVRQSRRQLQGLADRRQSIRRACLFARQRFSRHRLRRAQKWRCARARTSLCPASAFSRRA